MTKLQDDAGSKFEISNNSSQSRKKYDIESNTYELKLKR